MRTILLDNEAVAVLADPLHRKHRHALAHLQAVIVRRRNAAPTRVIVPTAVRVEAHWDRTDPTTAGMNRFRILDAALDRPAADLAASIARRAGVSVADAHLGAVARSLIGDDLVVLTSDPRDMVKVSAPQRITAVRI